MVVDLLERAAASREPGGVALASHESIWTFGELTQAVDARARELSGQGVSPGTVYPLVASADVEGITTLLACWRLGVTAAPLNPTLTEAERSIARDTLAGAAVTAQAILWTSGTSGRPRGVALSAANLVASCDAVAERLGLEASDCWLASLALAHVGGLVLVARALLTGATLVAAGRFDVVEASELLDGTWAGPARTPPVTHMSLVPTQLLRLLEHRGGRPAPESFRAALIGGAHAPIELVMRALDDGWPLALTYGMTEMTSQVATATPAAVSAKPGAVGRPLAGVKLRLTEGGEILLSGRTLALGYLGRDAGEITDEEGWYHTGDFGRVDEDGDLWVTGRRADRIISGGVTIDAHEVENALRATTGVVDVCVVGLPSFEWGEVVAAAVVLEGDALDLRELELEAEERLGPAKRPRAWRAETDLPRNANGKLDRAAVRSLFDRD